MLFKIICIPALLASCTALGAPLIVTPGDLDSYRIDVEVEFDGQIKKFQLDTGANTSMVAPDQQTLTYPSEGKAMLAGATGLAAECDLITPKVIVIGSLVVANRQLKRCDLADQSFYNLGLDVFKDQIFQLEFKNNSLSVLAELPKDLLLYQLTRLEKGHLKMEAQIDEQLINIIFDTGAQLTSVDLQFVESNPHLFKLMANEETGTDITGKPLFLKIYELSKVQVGASAFNNITVAAFDFGKLKKYFGSDTPIIFGTNAITKANWIFDLKSNQWGVLPKLLE